MGHYDRREFPAGLGGAEAFWKNQNASFTHGTNTFFPLIFFLQKRLAWVVPYEISVDFFSTEIPKLLKNGQNLKKNILTGAQN